MRAAFSKAEIESEISSRFAEAFKLQEKRPAEVIATGIAQLDSFTGGGLPRGAITEIFGPASSGRTSFMLATLAEATRHQEVCAVVDTNNSFDPKSAARAEINCDQLLWIRCANNLEHAFKATDLLLQGGGFGMVMLDLGDVPSKSAKRIISSWWYRFRRTLEAKPTALLVIAEESCVRSCATLALELRGDDCVWSSPTETSSKKTQTKTRSTPARTLSVVPAQANVTLPRKKNSPSHSTLLRALSFQVECHRPLYLNRRTGGDLLIKSSLAG
jgi:recombination protein RecA